jgi:hypothetical protein
VLRRSARGNGACERDLDELLDVRAATRENAISRERLVKSTLTATGGG